MVELIDARCYLLDEMASGLGQPDAACVTLEQEDSKVLLQSLHARADAGLCNPECVRRVAEVQMLGDRKRLDQRHERYARPEQRFT